MNFVFKQLRISDLVNRCSKTIEFAEHDNLITSDKNSMGKSVLLKSLYHSLGADAAFDKNFPEENVLFSLKFVYDKNNYIFLRYKGSFAILKNDKLIDFVNAGKRTDLSDFFKNEFGISVYLRNRKNTTEIAPPAYLFIPYYLDQDRSRKDEQEPFSKNSMGQYEPMSRNDLYLYHLGVYTSGYGKIKSDIDNLSKKINNEKEELNKLDEEYNKAKKIFDNTFVVSNTAELESIYRTKSKEVNELMAEQNMVMQNLFALDKKRTSCLIQIKENEKIIEKIEKRKNTNSLIVQCPNCKEEFDVQLKNDIVNIYSVVVIKKENESLKLEADQLLNQIAEEKNKVNILSKQIQNSIEASNSDRSDYEKFVTRKALSSLLDKQLREIEEGYSSIENDKQSLSAKKLLLSKMSEEKNNATNLFCELYGKYLLSLGILNFNQNDIKAFKKLALSGSQYVRSTLALYCAFIKTKERYNPNSFCFPIVIDSPREGEQDEYNSSKILETILNINIGNTQRIVASVNAKNYLSKETLANVNIINLKGDECHIMSKEEYYTSQNEIEESLSYFVRK